MPRLPVDGKKVIEHRITLGSKERTILEDLATSYRIDSISGNDSIVEVMADTGKIIAALGTLGALLELLGITDVFDFDDVAKAQVMEVKEKVGEKIKEKAADPSFIQNLYSFNPVFAGMAAGEYVAEEVYDRVN
tara:strand:+ start:773 stop:1174 length:402 start_codon:yes stop_codon:yes gene_type:complete